MKETFAKKFLGYSLVMFVILYVFMYFLGLVYTFDSKIGNDQCLFTLFRYKHWQVKLWLSPIASFCACMISTRQRMPLKKRSDMWLVYIEMRAVQYIHLTPTLLTTLVCMLQYSLRGVIEGFWKCYKLVLNAKCFLSWVVLPWMCPTRM